ncbi:hypothetical protein NDU88_007046 [Pleurodeles waltl]|uniref:Uncharacterized protein n=1 Tax=Pleurodeles waltl TaxID=8319 RepID=A0AAV7U2B8_PLEWA|nr:hypothetical protein NDU88_007046 [Pleurodeles waltl]
MSRIGLGKAMMRSRGCAQDGCVAVNDSQKLRLVSLIYVLSFGMATQQEFETNIEPVFGEVIVVKPKTLKTPHQDQSLQSWSNRNPMAATSDRDLATILAATKDTKIALESKINAVTQEN